MSTATHARRGALARFAALLRTGRTDSSEPRIVHVGLPGHQQPVVLYAPDPDPGEKHWEPAARAAAEMWGPGPAETEPWGPPCDRPDGLLMNGADLTDGRMVPGYVPEPPRRHSPDIAADLTALPLFRAAVEHRTRHRAGECRCGHQVDGQAWGERMVRAGQHLTGVEAAA